MIRHLPIHQSFFIQNIFYGMNILFKIFKRLAFNALNTQLYQINYITWFPLLTTFFLFRNSQSVSDKRTGSQQSYDSNSSRKLDSDSEKCSRIRTYKFNRNYCTKLLKFNNFPQACILRRKTRSTPGASETSPKSCCWCPRSLSS